MAMQRTTDRNATDWMGRRKGRRGFTLIEIMVVIAILVLLAAITLAVGAMVKKNAAIKNTRARLLTLKQMMTHYLENAPAFPITGLDVPATAVSPLGDDVIWVRALRSAKDGATLDNMPQNTSKDRVLDDFGMPIVYVPGGVAVSNASPTVVQEGYFWSYGPDQQANTSDDVRSTEAN